MFSTLPLGEELRSIVCVPLVTYRGFILLLLEARIVGREVCEDAKVFEA
jgi:hypothetical protein